MYGILSAMEKTMLVAGKDSPAGSKLAEGISSTGRNVMITGSDGDVVATEPAADSEAVQQTLPMHGITCAEWNRPSSLSARTLILQTENTFDKLDETVLLFDEEYYAALAGRTEVGECAENCDNLILGYQYLALETLTRFEKKNSGGATPGKLVFLLNEGPCMVDALRTSTVRNGSTSVATPLIASAAGAFASFAENMAAVYGDMEYVNIVLVRGDKSMDVAKTDDGLAKWLCTYLDTVDGMKAKLTAKKSIQWVKPGAKNPGGFSL